MDIDAVEVTDIIIPSTTAELLLCYCFYRVQQGAEGRPQLCFVRLRIGDSKRAVWVIARTAAVRWQICDGVMCAVCCVLLLYIAMQRMTSVGG